MIGWAGDGNNCSLRQWCNVAIVDDVVNNDLPTAFSLYSGFQADAKDLSSRKMKHAPSTFSHLCLCHPTSNTDPRLSNDISMSSKQRKKASLAALKSARSGRRSALDDVGLLEDDVANADVYEVMDEAEYRDYVQRKREREDFVVDDGERNRSSCSCSCSCCCC